MTPRRARLWHLPVLARILWSATRATLHPGADERADTAGSPHIGPTRTPSPRSRAEDLRLLARLVRRGQVRMISGRRGFIARDGMRIHALYTHPCARRQGIASRLMAEAQENTMHLELWTAQSNAAARRFYAMHGFYPARLGPGHGNDENEPDIQMIWKRNAP